MDFFSAKLKGDVNFMGKYDFKGQPNRFNTHAVKWQEAEKNEKLIPMWVADMDFFALPEITQAIHKYADYAVYGYSYAPDSLYQTVINWEAKHHHYQIKKEDIIFVDGVVPAISIAIQAFSQENDAVLINTPVYPPFARTVKLNHRKLIDNPLVEKDGRFVFDFAKIESDIVENDVKIYLICSPHNPGGRVWTAEELIKIGEICQKHGVILVSDEIHQDLALFGNEHHSFNTLKPEFKDFSIILTSATKTFNIAGVKNSFAFIENKNLRQKFQNQALVNNQTGISTLGYLATEAAYNHGEIWLKELKEVLEGNIDYLLQELGQKTKIKVMKPEGTYLVWLDFSAYGLEHQAICDQLKNKAELILNDGKSFGALGKQHMRFNVAAPFEQLKKAVDRIVENFD